MAALKMSSILSRSLASVSSSSGALFSKGLPFYFIYLFLFSGVDDDEEKSSKFFFFLPFFRISHQGSEKQILINFFAHVDWVYLPFNFVNDVKWTKGYWCDSSGIFVYSLRLRNKCFFG